MLKTQNIANLVKENKTVFIIIAVVLFLIELEIFAVAAMKSGRKAWLQIIDTNGNIVHETDGKSLSDFNKYYFEKTFGPLDQYEKKLAVKEVPFPFRAWFVAAVGIPIGVILLFAFVVKAYVSLFYGDETRGKTSGAPPGDKPHYESEFEKIIATVSSFNIFTIGFLILLSVFMYWVLPNMVTYIGEVSVNTLIRFKWVFIAAAVVLVGLFIWIIYLRYLLAKRSIDNQAELERVRLQLEFHQQGGETPEQLTYEPELLEENPEQDALSGEKNEPPEPLPSKEKTSANEDEVSQPQTS